MKLSQKKIYIGTTRTGKTTRLLEDLASLGLTEEQQRKTFVSVMGGEAERYKAVLPHAVYCELDDDAYCIERIIPEHYETFVLDEYSDRSDRYNTLANHILKYAIVVKECNIFIAAQMREDVDEAISILSSEYCLWEKIWHPFFKGIVKWQSNCGVSFSAISHKDYTNFRDTVEYNGLNFCHRCGKRILVLDIAKKEEKKAL